MTSIAQLREFGSCLLAVLVFLLAHPALLAAEERDSDFQGHYSNVLKSRIDMNKAEISRKLADYRKGKSIARLDESRELIIRTAEEIDFYFRNAAERVRDIPDKAKVKKLEAQIDKLEIINIRDVQMPYFCNQLYEVGQLYKKIDKVKARQCFRDIVAMFTSYESVHCREKAVLALEKLK